MPFNCIQIIRKKLGLIIKIGSKKSEVSDKSINQNNTK